MISQRKEPVLSLAYALTDKDSLVLIDKDYGEGYALKWVKAQLLDTFRILGASNAIASIQIKVMAKRIRTIYYYLSPSELTYFFESLIGGGYGNVYVGKTINPQNLMEALRKFDTERAKVVSEMEYQANKELKKEESKPVNMEMVNEICKRFRRQYLIDHIGCRAPKPYEPHKKESK